MVDNSGWWWWTMVGGGGCGGQWWVVVVVVDNGGWSWWTMVGSGGGGGVVDGDGGDGQWVVREARIRKAIKEFLQVADSGSITVTAGDLLQPERIQNGIVFNVVRKGDLTPSNRSHDSEINSPSDSVAECVQLDSLEKDMDASSNSECDVVDDEDGDHKTGVGMKV
ncbi:hypothetical protein QVD17_15767 [Tagetes erecta]|uniref:Uncharacterized protein n=1 Tax=Tagetes erecta TaxID=13708 RepID=A0AAD8NZZ5_TARER|nr:hypothetical protein QVD17_15767 [Tagetes erecta]